MVNIKHHYPTFLYTGAIALLFSLVPFTASAQEPDFSDTGRPSDTRDAGSRGGCPLTERSLTALVPTTAGGGWTTQIYPTVWVYIPFTLTATDSVRFVLRDDQGNEVYQTQMVGNQVPSGLISVSTTSPLEVGKQYQWHFMVYCGELADLPNVASGWIQRVELDSTVSNQIQQAAPQQRSALYAENLVWYDALTILGEQQRTNPGDRVLTTRWSNLLQLPSVGLDNFATDFPTPCCTLTP